MQEQIVNFVTNLALAEQNGGWGGTSAHTYEALRKDWCTHFVGPINPPYPTAAKAISKLRRSIGLEGTFSFFGESRLDRIAKTYAVARSADAVYDFFHGATPWVHCRPPVPYGSYIDATFPMYLDIYSRRETFFASDVARIREAEAGWMRGAAGLFFGSDWVRQEAVRDYGLDPSRCHVVWVGGNIEFPSADFFQSGNQFLFISLNFEKKGGPIAVEALQIVRRRIPDAELVIIGERPPPEVLARDGIIYAGRLHKTVPDELQRFRDLLASARALVHPTAMDTMGVVLIEAAYFGCPSIASNRFGIPELVLDGQTGRLLDIPIRAEQVAGKMLDMCLDDVAYRPMREAARRHAREYLTWDVFGARISSAIARDTGRLGIARGDGLTG